MQRNIKPIMSKEELAKMFGCSVERIEQQYAQNAQTLSEMRDKAVKTGKKQGNLTAGELDYAARVYAKLS